MLSVLLIAAVLGAAALYMIRPKETAQPASAERVVRDMPVLPQTTSVSGADTRLTDKGTVNVPLVPGDASERVSVPSAALTVKGALLLTEPEARSWNEDALLAFISSRGAITLEGKADQWQAVFYSASQKKGYELIIQKDIIVSKKELASAAAGGKLPDAWQDSDHPVRVLQNLPQFSDATISSIALSFSAQGNVWRYLVNTSRGPTSTSIN